MTTGTRQIHEVCYLNLMTGEGTKAKAFFSKLLGWTYGEMPGVPGGHLILVDAGREGRPEHGRLGELRPREDAQVQGVGLVHRLGRQPNVAEQRTEGVGGRVGPRCGGVEGRSRSLLASRFRHAF